MYCTEANSNSTRILGSVYTHHHRHTFCMLILESRHLLQAVLLLLLLQLSMPLQPRTLPEKYYIFIFCIKVYDLNGSRNCNESGIVAGWDLGIMFLNKLRNARQFYTLINYILLFIKISCKRLHGSVIL